MKHFELSGTVRQVGSKAVIKAFRKQGLVPCNLYGLGMENVLFTVSAKDLKGLTHTPDSFIVDITLDNGQAYSAVVHELQFHPIEDLCYHVDFLAVNEEKPIVIDVPLIYEGHPVGVQRGGKFVKVARTLRICALMKDLPDNIVIDTTPLDIEKRVVAGDVKQEGVTVVTPKASILCTVKATRNMTAQATQEAAE